MCLPFPEGMPYGKGIAKPLVENMKYTIFNTAWGYFGLAANKKGLIRTILPSPNRKTVEKCLLAGLKTPNAVRHAHLTKTS